MIAFRLVLLFVISWLGAVVFYSRRDLSIGALLAQSARRALSVSAWTVGAFGVMAVAERLWIDG
jgi:hypothetical protein